MRRILIIISLLVMCSFICVGCDKNDKKSQNNDPDANNTIAKSKGEWKFSQNIARVVNEDGWVYSFEHEYTKDKYKTSEETDLFVFNGINLRYRYHEDYVDTYTYTVDGKEITEEIPKTVLFLGDSKSEAINRDMAKVREILDWENRKVTKEDLLKLNPDDYTFEELDKELFFGLMEQALNGEPHVEGNNMLPSWAMLNEQIYIDGYAFQVGFVAAMGTVDVIFIDVLYKIGDNYDDYVQLSDMIDDKTATEEQIELYTLLKELEKEIIKENDLTAGFKEDENRVIADVSLNRLYSMMTNISNNNYSMYSTVK